MKEIGGYIEIEKNIGGLYHNNAVALNCGRNCLGYLIQGKNIKKIKLPKFLCNSVGNVCRREHVTVSYYSVGLNFLPTDVSLAQDEWLYIVNYYGQLNDVTILEMKRKYDRIIIDNAQAYFQLPIDGIDSLYTCRKFFGVSDGSFLYTDCHVDVTETDVSYNRMNYLLGRFEKGASEFYSEYVANNELFEQETIKKMSLLTKNILCGLDYDRIQEIRTKNFTYLHARFEQLNKLRLMIPEGAFMYPLYIENGSRVRTQLLKKKIYIPTLWPDVFELCQVNELEYDLAKNILPLPVDQRYDETIMDYIGNEIMEIIEYE